MVKYKPLQLVRSAILGGVGYLRFDQKVDFRSPFFEIHKKVAMGILRGFREFLGKVCRYNISCINNS